MADFQIEVDLTRLNQVIAELPGGAENLLIAAATEMVADIQLSMGTSPPGRTYTRRGVTHTASQAGYAPNPDTGNLKASITHTANGKLERIIHDQTDYGQHLEFGTEVMAARPFMRPVFEAWRTGRFAALVRQIDLVR